MSKPLPPKLTATTNMSSHFATPGVDHLYPPFLTSANCFACSSSPSHGCCLVEHPQDIDGFVEPCEAMCAAHVRVFQIHELVPPTPLWTARALMRAPTGPQRSLVSATGEDLIFWRV